MFNSFITHPILPFFGVLISNCPSIVDAFFMFTFIVRLLDNSDELDELDNEEDELDELLEEESEELEEEDGDAGLAEK